MTRSTRNTLLLTVAGTLAVAALAWNQGMANAQRPRERRENRAAEARRNIRQAQNDRGQLVLIHPTGDRATSNLLVEAISPAEVPVGKSYDYQLRVSNISRNLVLENVRITQAAHDGFSIENAHFAHEGESNQNGSDNKGENNSDQAQANQDEGQKGNVQQTSNRNEGNKSKKGNKNKNGDKDGSAKNGVSRNKNGDAEWTIQRLEPGESRVLEITAMSDKEGEASSCIEVHYTPVLCLSTRFTRPDVKVTKAAPDRANICRPLEIEYTVENTGTGVARDLVLTDDLPDGLKTDKGQDQWKQDIGDLDPGEQKRIRTTAHATRTGSFASRAEVNGANDLSARSNKPATKIVATDLALNIEGPKAQYVDRPMTYQVHVKNNGKARAMDTRLEVAVDRESRLLRMSKAEPGKSDPEQNGHMIAWDLGEIDPDGERTVSFTVVAHSKAELEHTATAASACAIDNDEIAQTATATRAIETAILTFPALRLEMVDHTDPVKVGDEEVYTITVRNQGSGADQNVEVKCNLPENFSFVSADGPGKANADGQTITLGPIDELQPHGKAHWELHVKAEKPGDVRNEIELSSEYLDSAVPEQEPTRVIASASTE